MMKRAARAIFRWIAATPVKSGEPKFLDDGQVLVTYTYRSLSEARRARVFRALAEHPIGRRALAWLAQMGGLKVATTVLRLPPRMQR